MNELQKRLERKIELRERVKRSEAEYKSHLQVVDTSVDVQENLDFFCITCNRDFTNVGYKRVGTAGPWPTAWYVGRCPCGATAIRRITDKSKDIYYEKSKMIKYQRVKNYNDMLTPADDLFKLIYPKEYERINAERKIK